MEPKEHHKFFQAKLAVAIYALPLCWIFFALASLFQWIWASSVEFYSVEKITFCTYVYFAFDANFVSKMFRMELFSIFVQIRQSKFMFFIFYRIFSYLVIPCFSPFLFTKLIRKSYSMSNLFSTLLICKQFSRKRVVNYMFEDRKKGKKK